MQQDATQAIQIIKFYSKTQSTRIKLFKSVYLQIKTIQNIKSKDLTIEILLYSITNNHIFFKIIRKVRQIDYLEQYLVNQYGQHVIPVLNCDVYFQNNKIQQTTLNKIQQYLNQIIKDYYCAANIKTFDFFFTPEYIIPEHLVYEKILIKAANYSRRYLNSIFARKQVHTFSNPYAIKFLQNYDYFKEFKYSFNEIRRLVNNHSVEVDLIEDIICQLSQLSCQAVEASIPNSNISNQIINKLDKMSYIVLNVDQSYKRWEILNEKVRELQGNVNKGLHQNKKQLQNLQQKLKIWTKSLTQQYQQIIEYGQSLIQKTAEQFMLKKSLYLQLSYQNNKLIQNVKQKSKYQSQKNQKQQLIMIINPQLSVKFEQNVNQQKLNEQKSTNSDENTTDMSLEINNLN